jgi:hypothetical protein
MGHDQAGFQLWWRQLTGSDATLDNAHVAEDTMYRIGIWCGAISGNMKVSFQARQENMRGPVQPKLAS